MEKKVIVSAKELERIKADIEPSNSSIVDAMAKLRKEMDEQRLNEKKYVVVINENLVTISSLKNEFPTKILGLKIKFDKFPDDFSFILAPVNEQSGEMSHILDEVDETIELVEHLYQEVLAINPRPIKKLTYIELLQQTLVRLYRLKDCAGGEERKGSER